MGIFIDTVELGDYGEAVFTTPGTYSWTCPFGVTSVSVVCVGGGQGGYIEAVTGGTNYGGGRGAALSYKNNISVIPGNNYTVVVGAGSEANTFANRLAGGNSYFINTSTVFAPGGGFSGSSRVGDGGGSGGVAYRGGGGAGGYAGNGGDGGITITDGAPGFGGGGGGGAGDYSGGSAGIGTSYSGAGGGVGIYGLGSDGIGGDFVASSSRYDGRMNGTAGSNGSATTYGGGGGGQSPYTKGGDGAVRIIWGNGRSFPNTLTKLSSTITQEELIFSGSSNLITIGSGVIMGGDLSAYAPPSPSIIADSLFMHLDASNSSSYSGSGSTWTDLTGNGNHGTINGATWSSTNGGIFDLDGINDTVQIAHNASLSLSTSAQRTVQVWFNTDAIPALNAQVPIVGKLSSSYAFDGYWAGMFSNGGVMRCTTNGAAVQRISNSTLTISAGTWYLMTFISQITSTSNTTKMYINGTEYITATHGADSYTESNPLYLGYIGSGVSSLYFNGKIGACYFYTKGLSAAEVTQNFDATKSRYGIS